MSRKSRPTTLSNVIGSALVSSLAAGSSSAATDNPFRLKELDQAYMHVAEAEKEKKELACGEGKCGAQMMKNPEMKCGAGMQELLKQQEAQRQKAMEGKCAGMTQQQPTPPASETKTN